MLHRILVLWFLAGTAAALTAQSNVSFEIANDPYAISNSNGYTPAVVAGDFNNDGKPDLVQCCGTNGLVFRAGNGDGTFQAPATAGSLPQGNNVEDLIAVDVNGDGKLDLVAMPSEYGKYSGEQGSGFAVWLGNGDGTFQTPQVYAPANSSNNPLNSLAVGDFFGDGHPDVAVAETAGIIELFRNEGNGSFVSQKSIDLSSGSQSSVTELAAGDLNGDGTSSLAAAVMQSSSSLAGPVYVLWGDGKGDFTQDELGTYNDVRSLAISRLNGDGMMDVLVGNSKSTGANPNDTTIDVYYGQGNNQLYKRTVVTDAQANLFQLAGADMNGDGYGDVFATGWGPCTPNPDVCASLYVWLGNADGSFQQTPQAFMLGNESNAGPFTMADFTRNGMMDAAMETSLNLNAEIMVNATSPAACGTYTINPSVTACQPVDNTYAPSPVRVEASSYDTTRVTAMQEYIDNKLDYSQPVTSFDTTFPETLGSHLFVTKAWDASGLSFRADRTVTVYSGVPGTVCSAATDTANICLPTGDTTSSPVEILANGNTGTSIATAAQLYIDGTLTVDNKCNSNQPDGCMETATSVQTAQNLAGGTHLLVFKIWSTDGSVYEAQKTITVN
jgi:hypothetical protein